MVQKKNWFKCVTATELTRYRSLPRKTSEQTKESRSLQRAHIPIAAIRNLHGSPLAGIALLVTAAPRFAAFFESGRQKPSTLVSGCFKLIFGFVRGSNERPAVLLVTGSPNNNNLETNRDTTDSQYTF